jgi:ubiquinone/menaquinone biosynthesis C-methylase UbiE
LSLEGMNLTSMLDVGAGTGLFAEAFAKHGLWVGGVDANPEMIPAAQKFIPDGEFKIGTAEALPFENGSFDLVFLGLVLHETDDPLKALQEARRIARSRVTILEWPYIEAEFGPPLGDRLPVENVLKFAEQAGFIAAAPLPLEHLLFYRFDIPQDGQI